MAMRHEQATRVVQQTPGQRLEGRETLDLPGDEGRGDAGAHRVVSKAGLAERALLHLEGREQVAERGGDDQRAQRGVAQSVDRLLQRVDLVGEVAERGVHQPQQAHREAGVARQQAPEERRVAFRVARDLDDRGGDRRQAGSSVCRQS